MTKSVMSPRARHGARRNEASVTSGAGSVALAVLLELVAELPETDAEQLGGAGLDSTGTRQGHLKVAVLDLVEHCLEIDAVRGDLHGDLLEVARLMEVGGKRLGFEDVSAAQDQRPLDHVLELSDVARPTVVLEDRERVGAHSLHGFAELRRDLSDELCRQERDVVRSLPKGRQVDKDDVQPIEEVLAKD